MPARDNTPMAPAWAESFLGYELAEESAGHSPKSIANRRSAVMALSKWLAGQGIHSPSEVTPHHMRLYFKHVYATRRGSGPRTHYNDLRAYWLFESAESGTDSPLAPVPRPRDVITPISVLSGPQVASVLAACSGRDFLSLRDRAMILMFLESGIRRAELAALDVADVDLRARVLTVRRGKGGKARTATFGPETASAVLRVLRRHPGEGALFTTSAGNRITASAIGYMMRRRGSQAGVEGLRPHLFRHAWTHYNLASGIQEHEIMSLAGWSSSQQLGRYGAALQAQRAVAAGDARPVLSLIQGGSSMTGSGS